ncbi:MAG: peptide deformylase [Proteobacteria bacterium]|nr:peptide deformylase [Pseudomonadota bacterium]
MNLLKPLRYPNPQLRQKAVLTPCDETLRSTIDQLFDTLYALHSWALAAPQVGISSRIFVMDLSQEQNQPQCFINPEIINKEGEILFEEDCMNFPGLIITVARAQKIQLRYQDENGNTQLQLFDGLSSGCLQKGVDALNGVLFIDHLSSLKRTRALAKYQKMKHVHHHGCHHGCDDH